MKLNLSKKELSITEILSYAWNFCKVNYKLLILILFLVYIPVFGIFWFFESPGAILVGILIGIIGTMGLAFAVDQKVKGKKVDYKSALSKSISRWPQVVVTSLIMGLLLIPLFILLIVPGIIFFLYWTFAAYAVLLRGKFGLDALKYSKSLVKGKWWYVFGFFFTVGLISIVITLPLELATEFLVLSSSQAAIPLILLSFIVTLLVEVYVITATVIFYLNLEHFRYKKEENLISL